MNERMMMEVEKWIGAREECNHMKEEDWLWEGGRNKTKRKKKTKKKNRKIRY